MSFVKYFFIICMLFLVNTGAFAQNSDWLSSPIKHPVRLAGTFGELRNNHFHTGIDIKSSNGNTGDAIFSVADGVVSRIKVSASGYGNALYIDHPNGYTTVYAHLLRFNSAIDSLVEQIQYGVERFEIDSSFTSNQLVVKQGQRIGTMGSTGRSFGPHLHFEVRETESEIPINPLFYNFDINDKVAPNVNYLIVNYLDDKKLKRGSKKINLVKNGNSYAPSESTLKIPAWRVGLAVFTRDLMTGVSNRNGIYSAKLLVDSKEVYSYEMDTISFDDFRYVNAHIDFDHYKKTKHRLHQLYRKEGNKIPIYSEGDDQIIKLYAKEARKIEIILSDYHKNESTIKFSLVRDTAMTAYKPQEFQYLLEQGQDHIINQEDIKIKFSAKAFYEQQYLSLNKTVEREENYASSIYHIGDDHNAIHQAYDVYIKPTVTDSVLLDKCTVVLCDKNKYVSYGAKRLDNLIGTKLSVLGTFVLYIDTIPPTIKAVSVPLQIKKGSIISLKVTDNLDTKGRAKDLSYSAWIDDQWILMKHDLKTDIISHKVDDKIARGKHLLKIIATDDRGNEQIWTKSIEKI